MLYLGAPPPDRVFALSFRELQSDPLGASYDRYALGVHHIAFKAPSRAKITLGVHRG